MLNEEQALYAELQNKQKAMKALLQEEVSKSREFIVENKLLHNVLIK